MLSSIMARDKKIYYKRKYLVYNIIYNIIWSIIWIYESLNIDKYEIEQSNTNK